MLVHLEIHIFHLLGPFWGMVYLVCYSAANTNLRSPEWVQLSAARIITGLRNTFPNDIVLYQADLQPLYLRENASLVSTATNIGALDHKIELLLSSAIGVVMKCLREIVHLVI